MSDRSKRNSIVWVALTSILTAFLGGLFWTKIQSYRTPLRYNELLSHTALESKIDSYLLAAVILQESRFQSDARSHAGALGLMQVLFSTGQEWQPEKVKKPEDLLDPKLNVEVGAKYLGYLLNRYDGSAWKALAAYNAGPNQVDLWLSKGLTRPQDIPEPETRFYVKKVLAYWNDYKQYYEDSV